MIRIEHLEWPEITESMHQKGYALVSNFLTPDECSELIALYDHPEHYRKTVVMERHRFGLGEYKYFQYPLPERIQNIRQAVYQKLVPIANSWMRVLNTDTVFPATLDDLHIQCKRFDQVKPTVLILKYGPGGHNTLHQDMYGEVFFPMQIVLFLNDPHTEYQGGEFVMTQQAYMAQSKPIVLKPGKGDMLIFTTNFRPVKGSKGYYKAKMKHGVSEVSKGRRHTLGIIFHDAEQ